MCGIVGAVAQRDITPVLVEGLKRLEYRGYDSCGVALYADGELRRTRSTQRVAELGEQIAQDKLSGFTGIAHTRWATHGAPATHNAHPHFSALANEKPRIALVHNGIIENYEELRTELEGVGFVFESQTDTEVIAHLVNHLYSETGLAAAVERWAAVKTRAMGLRPEFPFARLQAWSQSTSQSILVERRKLAPFGIYTLVTFERAALAA